jgi:hypothetical protein
MKLEVKGSRLITNQLALGKDQLVLQLQLIV